MTPDLESLLEFIATRGMGWEYAHGYYYEIRKDGCRYIVFSRKENGIKPFRPDLPNGQIEMVIDRMVEKGWSFSLEETNGSYPGIAKGARARFLMPGCKFTFADHGNRLMATLLAVKAALESK